MIRFYIINDRQRAIKEAKTTILKTNFCLVMYKTRTNFCWAFDKIPYSKIQRQYDGIAFAAFTRAPANDLHELTSQSSPPPSTISSSTLSSSSPSLSKSTTFLMSRSRDWFDDVRRVTRRMRPSALGTVSTTIARGH